MKIRDLIKETIISLNANKVRSGLTILGIVIGISSVIAMISLGQGASGKIQASIEGLGSNLLTIVPGVIQPGRGIVSSGRGSAQVLKEDDVEVLRKIEGVSFISPEVQRRFQIISSSGNNTNSLVIGALPEYADVRNIMAEQGSFISDANIRSISRIAVLGPTAAEDLFGDEDPIGKTIRVNKINFKVIGVLQSKGSSGFFNPDDTVFIPISTMQKVLIGDEYYSTIAVNVANKDLIPQVKDEAIFELSQLHRVDPQSPDFSIVSQAEIAGTLNDVIKTFTIFLASIAGISLIVGGIGIMNMMLTTVTERTKEIGLRKAIGAKRRDINVQFLTEAVILTFIGGIAGILLGVLISFIVSYLGIVQTSVSVFSIFLAFSVSALIGIIFGYYPAQKASRLNPIDALRYE